MSEPLVDRLRAALDEDERMAKAALFHPRTWDETVGDNVIIGEDDGQWKADGREIVSANQFRAAADDYQDAIHIYDEGGHTEEQAEHIARHDPARVLRQVAAMRKILDEHDFQLKIDSTMHGKELLCFCPGCGGRDWEFESVGYQPCPTIRALAENYEIEVDRRRFVARRIWGQDSDGNDIVIGHTEPELLVED
jgi:Family of unknown function (DUF6221)